MSLAHYRIWFNQFAKTGCRKIIVCAYNRTFQILQPAGKFIYPIIEFMVAQGSGIKVEKIHHLHFHITFEHLEI